MWYHCIVTCNIVYWFLQNPKIIQTNQLKSCHFDILDFQKPGGSVESSPNQQSSSGGDGGQQVTIMKKGGSEGNTEQSAKPNDGVEGKPANNVDAPKDENQAPAEPQSKTESKPDSIINTDAPSLNTKEPLVHDQSKVFVPISGQSEKVPISSVGGINVSSYPTGKEREAMVPPMQTFITPSTGSGVTVGAIISTPPRNTQESEEEERERQLTERLAEQGDRGMANNPDSASTLLPEVSQLFNAHSQGGLGGQGGVPLPGQIMSGPPMQGGYGNYPGAGYNYNNMGSMQGQHGYYSWGVPGGRMG